MDALMDQIFVVGLTDERVVRERGNHCFKFPSNDRCTHPLNVVTDSVVAVLANNIYIV